MRESESEEEILEPLSLDRSPSDSSPRALPRRMAGLLLFPLLLLWSLVAVNLFDNRQADGAEESQDVVSDPRLEPTATPPETVDLPETVPEAEESSSPVVESEPEDPAPAPMLTLRSVPSGARVVQNAVLIGSTPLVLEEWEAGQEVVLRSPGFQSETRRLPAADASQELIVTLTKDKGPIRLSGDWEGAELRVNGEAVTPETDGTLLLPFRENELRIEKSGYQTWMRTVRPARAYQREVVVTLRPEETEKKEQEPGSKPVQPQVIVENIIGLKMMRPSLPVEADIGSPRGAPGRKSHEGIRRIRLERPFRISQTEISNEQFARFDPSHSSGRAGSIGLSTAALPVVSVSWEQAVQFCNWLSAREHLPPAYVQREGRWVFAPDPGTGYRLPTEAEWEGLLRRNRERATYAWGDSLPPPEGSLNIAGQEMKGEVRPVLPEYRDSWKGPAPVSEAPVGPASLRGFAGNVREWVHDGFAVPPPGREVQVDPIDTGAARFHVIKGAGWQDGNWTDLRAGRRAYDERGAKDVGFRVARYLTER